MTNDHFNIDRTNPAADATVRPQERMREMTVEPQQAPVQQMQMAQQTANGIQCQQCGTMNEPEAIFCASCGRPLRMVSCPHCGAMLDPDADFCETCHHYVKSDVCSFCGAHMQGNEAYCPECGSPRGGLVCPVCRTLNDFAFCKQCGTALTNEAMQLVKELQKTPEYAQLVAASKELAELDNCLPATSERDILRDKAGEALRQRVLTLLAQDNGVANPIIEPKPSKRMTKEELEQKKREQMDKLSEVLGRLAVQPQPSPAKARNYAMASKPAGVRLAWVCNYKHAMHSSPCGCAKPQLGGKWVILGKNSNVEIKDDNK